MREDIANLLPKEEALARALAAWTYTPAAETVPLCEADGRVLAEDQYARYDLPVVRASTMDGIAVHSERFSNGTPDTSRWRMGVDFIRADTGDDFDDAYDAVIAIENVELLEDGGVRIRPNVNASAGFNVKGRGSDVRKGELLARRGTVLQSQDLAAIAMGGIREVPVVVKPKVSFLPTGSELIPVGAELHRGQNFDTNSILIFHMLREMGAEPVMHPIIPDEPDLISAALEKLLPESDIVLVGAGTSKGGEDYSAKLLEKKGTMLFHGVAAVPGRPMSVTMVEGKPVVNLSGPAFGAFYGMDWLVRAMVSRALGIAPPVRETVKAVLKEPFQMPPFFSLMACFHVERDGEGRYMATPLPLRGPRSIGSAGALTANGVYLTKLGEHPHAEGEEIEIELMRNRAWL